MATTSSLWTATHSRSLIRPGLMELLSLQPERTAEFRVERSLWMSAHNDAELAEVARGASADLTGRIVTAIERD
ncbi:hypothetical protein ACWDYH_07280 [Nocardia goodfellowii]